MPIFSGYMSDFGDDYATLLSPEVILQPSGTGVTETGQLLSKKRKKAAPGPDGFFSFALFSGDEMLTRIHYKLSIRSRDPEGGFRFHEFPDWELYMPLIDCTLADMLQRPSSLEAIWKDTSPPPLLYPGVLWIDLNPGPEYGHLKIWEN